MTNEEFKLADHFISRKMTHDLWVWAQNWTETAWSLALEYNDGRINRNDAVKEIYDCCGKLRGIGFIRFEEDGKTKCLFCRAEPKESASWFDVEI